MLSNRDTHSELEKIDEVIKNGKPEEVQKANLKATSLLIKLLLNVRTNMVTIMKSYMKIDLIKPDRREDNDNSEE